MGAASAPVVSVHVADARAVLQHPSVTGAEERRRAGGAQTGLRSSVAEQLLLRLLVGGHQPEHLHVAATPCPRCGGPHGPLRITEESGRRWHASVSSGGRFVAAAVNEDFPVGIDVVDREVAHEHLPADARLLHPLDDPTTDRLRLWVRKTAVLDARCDSPRVSLSSFPATGQHLGGYRGVHLSDVHVDRYPDAVVAVGLRGHGTPQVDLSLH